MTRCPFCAEEIQDAAIVCKHCGCDLQPTAATSATAHAPAKPTNHWFRNTLVVVGALIVLAVIGNMISDAGAPSAMTAEHRMAIEAAHKPHAWELPVNVEISSAGFVVADYQVPVTLAIPPRTFGQERLLAIREALLPFGFKNFRVNVNGPPPGTGLIRRFGSARFIDGGCVEWLTP